MNESNDAGRGEGLEDSLGLNAGVGAEMEVETPRRSASLTLTTDESREARAASMEAAHRSLAEALGITYRVLQLLIVALVVLFLFSGVQPVNETQRALKTRFGAVVNDNIDPGFVFSLPYPIGDVRTARGDERSITIDRAFFPTLSRGELNRPIAQQSGNSSLNPTRDGSLITADGNLGIARIRVTYRIDDASQYIRNLGYEADLSAELFVRAAVQAATVSVAATVPIDSLVGRSVAGLTEGTESAAALAAAAAEAGGEGEGEARALVSEREVQRRILRLAQDRLDALDSGIVLTNLILSDAFPPRNVLTAFRRALDEVSQARGTAERARADAESLLVTAVGSDYEALGELLDLYESAVESGDGERESELRETIFDVLQGAYADEPLVVDGRDLGRIGVSGEVAQTLGEARAYRSSIPNFARSQAETFAVKLEQFRRDPEGFVAREWADAFQSMLEDPDRLVTVFTLPAGVEDFRLRLNNDPEVQERIEREQNRRLRDEAEREREEMLGIE